MLSPGLILVKQFATKDRIICPALIFAINRTVRVKGRISSLTVSIKTSKGVKTAGAPAGARWAADIAGLFTHPEISSRPHSVKAIDPAVQRFLVIP